MSANEDFYDSEVSPVLMKLAKACEARGMAFVCAVEYDKGLIAETSALPAGHGIEATMAFWGVRARGNVDSFMIAAERHALKHGHQSAYLHLRGIPTSPASPQVPKDG